MSSSPPSEDFIAAVPPPQLRLAADRTRRRPVDPSSARLMEAERRPIAERRKAYGLEHEKIAARTGLALSGGGIRSATFALGVLQALAARDLLKRFDYLSTVSGGGYIGSSLTWWASGESGRALGVGPGDAADAERRFPYGTDDPSEWRGQPGRSLGARLLAYLRTHGNYLIPGEGITILSVLSVVVRGTTVQLVFWLPLLALVLLPLIALLGWMTGVPAGERGFRLDGWSLALALPPVIAGGLILALVIALLGAWYWRITATRTGRIAWWTKHLLRRPHPVAAPLGLVAATLVLTALLLRHPTWPGLTALLAVAAMMVFAFLPLSILYAVVTGVGRLRAGGMPTRMLTYDMRRLWETWAGFGLAAVIALALLGAMPVLAELLKYAAGQAGQREEARIAGGVIALLIGMATTGYAYYRTARRLVEGVVGSQPWLSAAIACGFLLLGAALLAHQAAEALRGLPAPGLAWLALLLLLAVFGWFCDINQISVHRMYRDRLMEAFMPAFRDAVGGRTSPAPEQADSLSLADAGDKAKHRAPYHIINTNAVLVNARARRTRIRGGDSFILSPLYCGSNVTGWRGTRRFMGDGMTLPTAMAISGAAANPNTGVGGIGLTRSRLVSVVMALVNLRLGYWVPHPAQDDAPRDAPLLERLRRMPNQFWPGLCAFLPWGHRENSAYHELSDGGHFENLGLYELVRRRLKVIVVCDGSADPEFRFGCLQLALRRIGEDFGARVIFDADDQGQEVGTTAKAGPLDRLIPADAIRYPEGARLATCGCLAGRIVYADGKDGLIVYLKTALVPHLALALLGYRGANADFPDEPTSDQFFDEEQFEAYRELGFRIADAMIAETGLAAKLEEAVSDAP